MGAQTNSQITIRALRVREAKQIALVLALAYVIWEAKCFTVADAALLTFLSCCSISL